MGSLLWRLKGWWTAADRTQKTVTVVGGALLIVLVAAVVVLASRPKMEVLFSDLSPADQGMVREELESLGIRAQYGPGGQVLVPSARVTEARAKLAMADKLPQRARAGALDLKEIGMMNTPNVEMERIKAAHEKDLAATIEMIDGVRAAVVHLAPGERRPFSRESLPPRASVSITETRSGAVGPEEAAAIARLVQSSVNGLSLSDVTIISNTRGLLLFDGAQEQGSTGIASAKIQAEIAEARRRQESLQRQLEQVLGLGNVLVSVECEMDFDEERASETVVEPSESPLTEATVDENFGSRSTSAAGAGLTEANIPQGSPVAGSGSGTGETYRGKQEQREFGRAERSSTRHKAPGSLTGMTINVVVNEDAVDEAQLAKVTSILDGVIGHRAGDPRFVATVTSAKFDQTAAKRAADAAAAAARQARIQQAISLLPVLALLVVGFMVVRALGRAIPAPAGLAAGLEGRGAGVLALGPEGEIPEGLARSSEGSLPLAGRGSGNEIVSAEELSGEAAEGSHERVRHRPGPAPVEIEAIEEQVNVPLEQIRRLSKERPEAVATILRSWMAEERR